MKDEEKKGFKIDVILPKMGHFEVCLFLHWMVILGNGK
jgi:hypothetical protein